MIKTTMSRRQFLVGAGGFALAIPVLPSLLPREAHAMGNTTPRRFVSLATHHGGIWTNNFFPNRGLLTASREYAGHTIRSGALRLDSMGAQNYLSPTLSADRALFPQAIADKMNVIQGIDIPWYIAHHTGGFLGNYGRNDGNDPNTGVFEFRPTMDQIMAWSNRFYPNLDHIMQRSMVIGAGRMSYQWSNPAQRTGDIIAVTPENSSLSLFHRIFQIPDEPEVMRTPVVDRVVESYQQLRQSNRRLSVEDRRRLDDHLERIFELQRRLNTVALCTDVPIPERDSGRVRHQTGYSYNPDAMTEFWQLHNDVIAVAFACDSCRVVTMHCGDTFSTFQGDWHQDVAHRANLPEGAEQEIILEAHRRFFADVFLDLVNKLDIEEEPGVTILDRSLVMWSQESGNHTHDSYSIPIVTAGSANGSVQTGRYIDYRNLGITKTYSSNPDQPAHPGLIHNQFLGNVLQAMGLERSEYDLEGHGGYGILYVHPLNNWFGNGAWWTPAIRAAISEPLPYFLA
jgi:hypothetical protein